MNYIVSFFTQPIPDYTRIIETQSRVISAESYGNKKLNKKRK